MPSAHTEADTWYETYAWASRFHFKTLLRRGVRRNPLMLFEPEAIQLMDRALAWLECYIRHKGFAKPPRPEGTRAELFLLLSHFQIVHSLMRDTGPTDLRSSRPFMHVSRLFVSVCPPPPEADGAPYVALQHANSTEVFRRIVMTEPLPHALDWNPVYVDGSVFRRMKETLAEDYDLLEEGAQSFERAAA